MHAVYQDLLTCAQKKYKKITINKQLKYWVIVISRLDWADHRKALAGLPSDSDIELKYLAIVIFNFLGALKPSDYLNLFCENSRDFTT